MDAPDKVLEVRNLHVEFRRDGASTYAVKDVSFDVYRGRTLGIVGESGSGKSVSCLAVMGLLPKSAVVSGHAWLQNTPQPASHSDNLDKTENSEYSEYSEYSENSDTSNTDLLTLNEDAYLNIRGCRIGMIFQEPMTSLNPVHRCGD